MAYSSAECVAKGKAWLMTHAVVCIPLWGSALSLAWSKSGRVHWPAHHYVLGIQLSVTKTAVAKPKVELVICLELIDSSHDQQFGQRQSANQVIGGDAGCAMIC